MSAACAGMHLLWGWIAGGIRSLFKRERRRKVAIELDLAGSVVRNAALGFDVVGSVLHHVEKQVDLVGENFTGIVYDLLIDDEEDD